MKIRTIFIILLFIYSALFLEAKQRSNKKEFLINNIDKNDPTDTGYGWWKINTDDDQRFLVMDSPSISNEEALTRSRICDPGSEFNQIYTSLFGSIIISNTFDPGPRSGMDEVEKRAAAAKNCAFIYRMGIRPDGTNLTTSELNILKERVDFFLCEIDTRAWEDVNAGYPELEDQVWLTNRYTNDDAEYVLYRSYELINYLQAFDLMRPCSSWSNYNTIVSKLYDFSGNLSFYSHYTIRYWYLNNYSLLSKQNYRFMLGSAIGTSALVLPFQGSALNDYKGKHFQPLYKIGLAMNIINNTAFDSTTPLITSDGGYLEGTHYFKFSCTALFPFFRGMQNFGRKLNLNDPGKPLGDWTETYYTYNPFDEPVLTSNLIRTQWFGRVNDTQPDFYSALQWIKDIHMPNGKLPPLQDSFLTDYFLELSTSDQDDLLWENDKYPSQVCLLSSLDSRVEFLVAGLLPQSVDTENLVVYPVSGDIVFRSSDDLDALYLHAYAKNYKYSRHLNNSITYYSHFHRDNTSYMINYKGENLALDPGYIDFENRELVNEIIDHNLIIAYDKTNYLSGPYSGWTDASTSDIYESGDFSQVSVTVTEWKDIPNFIINRSFIFVDKSYFVITDDVNSSASKYELLFHGNGGQYSHTNNLGELVDDWGSFQQIGSNGGIWKRENGSNVGIAVFSTVGDGADQFAVYEDTNNCRVQHETSWQKWSYHAVTGMFKNSSTAKFLTIAYPFDYDYHPNFAEISGTNYTGIVIDRSINDLDNRYDVVLYKTGIGTINIPQQTVLLSDNSTCTINPITTDASTSIISLPLENELTKLFAKGVVQYNYGILHFTPSATLTSEFTVEIFGSAAQGETYNYCEEDAILFPLSSNTLTLENGSNSTFASANSITLKPGFRAESGSSFHACVDGSINNDEIDGGSRGRNLIAVNREIINNTLEPADEPTGTNNNLLNIPDEYCMFPNYPNPFNPSTTIRYGLPEQSKVDLQVYNIRGQLVKTLDSVVHEAGYHEVTWNGDDNNGKTVSSGIYFYKLQTSDFTSMKKMILLK